MNVREKDFIEKFRSNLREFREVNINLQHDFIHFNRLRDGIETSFKTVEERLSEVTRLSRDLEKTSDFYRELQDTFKDNNLKLQDFIAKLNAVESDFRNKEESVKQIENSLNDFKESYSKEILNLESAFSKRLNEVEKNINQGYEQVINLSKINTDKLKQQYADLEADFKDSIDILVKEEREHLQNEIERMRSNFETEIQVLQENLSQRESQVATLMDRYGTWEKEVAEHQDMTQKRIDKFSATILSGFKEKINDYQEEVLSLLEDRYKKLNNETTELEARNRLKEETLDSLQSFMDESKKTITYQINNLSGFLEKQKEMQSSLYQKNHLVLVDIYKDVRSDFDLIKEEVESIKQNRNNILFELSDSLDMKLNQMMMEEVPRVLLEVLSGAKVTETESGLWYRDLRDFFNSQFRESIESNLSWLMDYLKGDSSWQSFLDEQSRLKLLDNLDSKKLGKEYTAWEEKFRKMVDDVVAREEDRLQKNLIILKNNSEKESVGFQANFQEYEDKFSGLLGKYEDWEKKVVEDQEKIREQVERFSEEVLFEVKQKGEEYQQGILEELKSSTEKELIDFQANFQGYEDKFISLLGKYEDWEKKVVEDQEKIREQVERFSEEVLFEVKQKGEEYQQEIVGQFEKSFFQIEEQANKLEARNRLKEEALDSLQSFMDESKKTITYQINNLSGFLEKQKEMQSSLYQKNHLVLVDIYKDVRSDFDLIKEEVESIKQNRNNILFELSDSLDMKLNQMMMEEVPRVLLEVLSGAKVTETESGLWYRDLRDFFNSQFRESIESNLSWLMDYLKGDSSWQSFLDEQSRLKLLDNLDSKKLGKEYTAWEEKFRKMVDDVVAREEDRLQKNLIILKNNSEKESVGFQANFQEYEDKFSGLLGKYEDWEKKVVEDQEKIREQVERFSEEVLFEVKQKGEEYQQGILEELKSSTEKELIDFQANFQGYEDKFISLLGKYEDWEKKVVEDQEKIREQVERFSEEVLFEVKQKGEEYQQEIVGQFEKSFFQIEEQANKLEARNRLKEEALDSLQSFMDESKKTITYQINNLSGFLEKQKEMQSSLYQKNHLVLVDIYKDVRSDFDLIKEEVESIKQNRNNILFELSDSLDMKLNQMMMEEVPRVLLEVLSGAKVTETESGLWYRDLRDFFNSQFRESIESNLSWLMDYLKGDSSWQSFLDEQSRLKLLDNLDSKKLGKEYTAWEEKFRKMVDDVVAREEDRLQKNLIILKNNSEKESVGFQANFQEYEDKFSGLLGKYEDWEKKVVEDQEKIREQVERFSEEVLFEVKQKGEEYQQGILEELKSSTEKELIDFQANFQGYEDKFISLLGKYEDWEKKVVEDQEKIREQVERFSEEVLFEVKQKGEEYQQEIVGQFEKSFFQIEEQANKLEARNRLKEEALDSLQSFMDESKKTITYQINNLSGFLEKQKKKQAGIIDNSQETLNNSFEKVKSDLVKLQADLSDIQKKRRLIRENINDYIEDRLYKVMSNELPRLLQEIFSITSKSDMSSKHKNFLFELDRYLTNKIKNSVSINSSWIVERLQRDSGWQTFLKEQVRINLISKLKTEKIFNELKRNFSKEFFRRELQEEIKNYRKGIEGIDKNWKKLSEEVVKQKKFLDKLLVQGEDRIEYLVEGIKLNLADKEQSFQDTFNEMVMGMEKKIASVTDRIDFFLSKTKSVDKIFIFQKEFTSVMANYEKQLSQLKKTEKRFADFQENFQKLEKEHQHLQVIHKNLKEKESNVLNLAQQLETIMNMTGEIEGHINTVKSQSSEIDRFLSKLQDYNQDINAIKKEFGNLKELQGDFYDVKKWVKDIQSQSQQNQEKTDIFLGRVAAGEELQKKVTDNIKSLEQKSLSLDERYKALEYLNKKFDNFDIAVYDLEKRIEVIRTLKKEMLVEQDNLNLLKEGFNEQISIILKIFQNQRENDSALFTELDKKFKSLPKTLSHIGWSDKEIAKHLDLELYEVQLLLNRKKRKK